MRYVLLSLMQSAGMILLADLGAKDRADWLREKATTFEDTARHTTTEDRYGG